MRPAKKIVLKNGLRLILVPQPSGLAASVLILVTAGSEYETKDKNGISHFLEHMTFKGTARRPQPGMIAEEIAALGAQANAFTTQEFTGYWAKAEARKLPQIFDIVTDLYLHPLFSPPEIEKERGVIIEEMNMYEDIPMRRVEDVLRSLLYGDQPAGWKVDGEKEIVKKLSREDFVAYRNERYVMPGTVVVVAGKFNEKKVVGDVRRAFGGTPRHHVRRKTETRERQSGPRLAVKFKKSDQGHLAFGFRAFNIYDPRRYALQVLADVLGGGTSSRLWKRVREELGAAYYVQAEADLSLDHGMLGISAGADRTRIGAVVEAILAECRKLARESIPKKELQKSKDHLIGSLILGLETSDELGSFYGGQEILTKALLPPGRIIDRIKATTAEEVRAVARTIFKNQGLNLAVIGPYRNRAMFKKILTLPR